MADSSRYNHKNPWCLSSSIETSSSPSLKEVMSEQLAHNLQFNDQVTGQTSAAASNAINDSLINCQEDDDETSNDFKIAQMLQKQFDKEAEELLSREESHVNGTSKLTVCYDKYRPRSQPNCPNDQDSYSEDEDDLMANDDKKGYWDVYEQKSKEMGRLPKCGYKKIGEQYVTKHDKELNHRENGKRVMEFPPGIDTGDGASYNGLSLSNKVYSSLKNFSIKESKKRNRNQGDREEKTTAGIVLDASSKKILMKLEDNNILKQVNGAISTGKEAIVYHADGGLGMMEGQESKNYDDNLDVESSDEDEKEEKGSSLDIPADCAVKVFKTTLNEFKNRDKYIRDDYRFKDRFSKQNPRKLVTMWAEKELHNLNKMFRFGLPVPKVVILKKHVLVMEFLGKNGVAAPKLCHAVMSYADLESAYDQIINDMKTMYSKCHLVHADLSPYNILWHDDQCYYIDVAQSVEPNHPHGLEFLMQDCKNISNFFSKKNLASVMKAEELFNHVSGLSIRDGQTEAEIIAQIKDYEKDANILSGLQSSEKEYAFDYCWNKSKNGSISSMTEAQSIPGRSGQRSSGSFKKSPKLNANVGSASASKSLISVTDSDLQKLKESLQTESSEKRKSFSVKLDFDNDSLPL